MPPIVSLPDGTGAGRVSTVPVHGCDLFPSLLELAGVPPPVPPALDGVSLAPLLRGGDDGFPRERTLFWHYPYYNMLGATPASAVRQGDYKLIEFFETGRCDLYDLRNDPAESRDLAADRPKLRDRLKVQLRAMQAGSGSLLPVANPAYAGTEPVLSELHPFESTRTVPAAK